jgi:hypothetical protein
VPKNGELRGRPYLVNDELEYADEPVIRRLWAAEIVFSNVEILLPGGGFDPGFDGRRGFSNGAYATEPVGPVYRIRNPNHIANETGGDAVRFLDPQNPLDFLTPIRQSYTLWFRQPEGLEPGQQRSIRVDLSPEMRERYPDAVVKARSGYITR